MAKLNRALGRYMAPNVKRIFWWNVKRIFWWNVKWIFWGKI